MMISTSLTYGQLPTREVFDQHFEAECPMGTFEIKNHPTMGDMRLSADQTWALVVHGAQEWNEGQFNDNTDLAGAILYLIGIEWI